MPITPGTRLGPYEVIAPLGAGGMGEVWRGRDTRLDRSVAIKVLPAELSQSAELRARFEREARAISSLTDPHICTLYDVGHQDGIDYLVMELVEGESLSDRLARGPLAIEQVLRHGIEIAEALDKAHRRGIIHRDLKPGNIMLTKSGAKLLDFGLAKMAAGEGPVVQLSHMPTAQRQLTAEGTIVGTFQYMAPEQLDGTEADARTDIFSFGAVLYEMATGRRAFEGKTKSSLIAAIVDRDPPPISSFQPLTPPALERVIKGCLAKDPEDRWQSARDIANELRWIQEAGSGAGIAAPVVHRRKLRERTAWMIAIALLATSAFFAYQWRRAAGELPRRFEASILPPEGSEFVFGPSTPALSPDGTRVVLPVRSADGKAMLCVRRLANGVIQTLPGTETASSPFWSPDGRFIAFFSSGKLRKVDSSGGPPQAICDTTTVRGGTWSPSGDIVFAPSDRDALYRVSASGGTPVPVTQLDTAHEYSHRWPWFLPDGKHFLYLAQTFGSAAERGRIYVGALGSNEKKLVVVANSAAVYSSTGHVLYSRDRTLVAQPFDVKDLAVHGDATVLADDIYNIGIAAVGAFSASQNGVLSYYKGTGMLSQFVWRDRTGKLLGISGNPGEYARPQLAHDGRHFSYEISDAQGNSDIWIYDIVRQTSTRFTFGPGTNTNAIWSRDDRFLAYSSEQLDRGTREIARRPSSGIGAPEILFSSTSPFLALTDWSPDGKFILLHVLEVHSKTGLDDGYYSIPDRKIIMTVQTPAFDCCGRLSPDGRWLAYTSAASGRNEIYVQPFPVATGRFQISTMGGNQPRWSADGKELFYASADGKVMTVDVHPGETFEAGVPKPLFNIRPKAGGWPFDVSRDGRFLINETVHADTATPVTVVVNWNASS